MNKKINCLDNFKLRYEDMEFNKMKKISKVKATAKTTSTSITKRKTPKLLLKDRFALIKRAVIIHFNNILKKIGIRGKKTKKVTKTQKKFEREQQLRGILGIGLLFVVVSIIYSTYIIFNGISSTASKVMIIPQATFAVLILYKAFSKIYK